MKPTAIYMSLAAFSGLAAAASDNAKRMLHHHVYSLSEAVAEWRSSGLEDYHGIVLEDDGEAYPVNSLGRTIGKPLRVDYDGSEEDAGAWFARERQQADESGPPPGAAPPTPGTLANLAPRDCNTGKDCTMPWECTFLEGCNSCKGTSVTPGQIVAGKCDPSY